ncbi:acyl-CoA dehydrogenase family protein [Novosphingobium tardum]|uniref:Acyl-CoA dehydrogenase family protein n=1 Tax=Novosphingobium tardum TaxID=1538021 RepID=A0ABV8RS28_9SPHN
MDTLLEDMFARLLARSCSTTFVRAAERDPEDKLLALVWDEIEESGLPNALVAEQDEGFGLSLAQILPLVLLMGAHAFPLPLAETMVARALLRRAGVEPPLAPIILATALSHEDQATIQTAGLPLARTAGYMLVARGETFDLVELSPSVLSSSRNQFSLSARVVAGAEQILNTIPSGALALRETIAFLHAAKLAGAMQSVLQMTIDYAQTRSQFGRPIGKFQAIQQQVSVMAEHVAAARMAVQLASGTGRMFPDPLAAGVAKECASSAALVVAQIAHSVHGAIGISREHDLQLYTRRMAEWRAAEGAESYWATQVGREFFASNAARTADFVRTRLSA